MTLFHNPMDDGESQPSPFAGLLCRKEGLKELGDSVLVHAASGVGDRQDAIPAWIEIQMLPGKRLIEFNFAGLDRQRSPFGHGVSCIHREIHQDLLQL